MFYEFSSGGVFIAWGPQGIKEFKVDSEQGQASLCYSFTRVLFLCNVCMYTCIVLRHLPTLYVSQSSTRYNNKGQTAYLIDLIC